MAEISAQAVKELREKTDAGMMDCKRALVEAGGDMGKAIEILRKAGIAKAEKKSGRATKEGRIVSFIDGGTGVLLEALCETDFVATNQKFTEYINELAARVAGYDAEGDVSKMLADNEKASLTALIATIGENMQLRRALRWVSKGSCASYLHMGGRIGVLVDVEGDSSQDALNDLCMHIAAFKPDYVTPEEIPADVMAKEKDIAAHQVKGKPADIAEKIVMGKISKWYKEVCLVHQPWIRDDKQTVQSANPGMRIKRFVRWEIGEDI
ncbi:MAG: elongation factor Ts [Victivallales bacterium]|nr:elongation factor Ts [Victivallales bacterium]